MVQVGTARADIPATGHGIAAVRGVIGTTVTATSGNRGFVMATDHAAGRYIAVAAWSDDASVEAQQFLAPDAIADVETHLGVSEPTVETFDLVVSHLVKILRIGYWGQLTRIRLAPGESDLAARRFRDTFVPGFEHDDGLAGISLLLNRESGNGYTVEWYDSLLRLRGNRAGAQESGQLMLAAVPTLTVLETVELQVVVVEQPDGP